MSLINEALKQAKSDMSSRQPPIQRPEPPLPPGVPPPKLRDRKRRTGEILLGAFIFILLLLVLGGVAGGLYFIMSHRRPPSAAKAHSPPQTSASAPTAPPEGGRPLAPKTASPAATPPKPRTSGKTTGTETPATPLGKAVAKARNVAHKVANLEAQAGIMNPPAAAAAKPAPAKQPVDSAPEPAPPKIARKYRLTGIVQSGAERLALINGAIVRKGQRIRGGRLVRVEDTWVAIETEGKIYRLDLPMDSVY